MCPADATPGYDLGAGTYIAPGKPASAAAPAEDDGRAQPAVHGELCALYSKAMQRLEAVGRACLFGEECAPSWSSYLAL